MTPAVIAAIASGASVIISAVFAGLLQLQHQRTAHGTGPDTPPAGGQPPAPGPGARQ